MIYQRALLMSFCMALLIGFAVTLNLGRDIGRPYSGYLESYNPLIGRYSFNGATPLWWPGVAPNSPVKRDKDPVIDINGHPNNYTLDKRTLYQVSYEAGVSSVLLTLESQPSNYEVLAPIYLFSVYQYLDIVVPDIIICLCFIAIGWAVFRAEPTSNLNRIFAFVCLVVAMNRWLGVVSIFQFSTLLAYMLDFTATAIVNPFFGVALLHFALRFPEPSRWYRAPIIWGIYGIGILIGISWGTSRLLLWLHEPTDLIHDLDEFSFYTSYRLFAFGLGVLFVRIVVWLFREYRSRRVRHQGLWLVIGFLIGLPYPYIQVFGGLGYSQPDWLNSSDWRYTLLIFPLIFGVIILRYRSFKPVPPQFLIVVIVAVSGLLASVIESGARQLYPFLQESARLYVFLPLFAAFTGNALVWSFQGQWQGYFGRLLHWEQKSFSAVSRFSQHVSKEMKWEQLPELLVETVQNELEVEHVALWRYQATEDQLILVAQDDTNAISANPLSFPLQVNNTQTLVRRVLDLPQGVRKLLQPCEILVILQVNDVRLGILALGKRWDEEVFDQRDEEILGLLGHQMSVLLLAADHVHTVSRIPERVARAQEHERLKIARELHDTTQQFLGRLPFFLDVGLSDVITNPVQTQALLERLILDVEKASKTLREIQSDLALSELDFGLEQPLRKLITAFTVHTSISVTTELPREIDQYCPVLVRQTLYRVVQQALDNIEEHADASEVKVTFTLTPDAIILTILDNGKGFEQKARHHAQQTGSFGLLSMEGRVASIRGHCTINSAPGKGTKIEVIIPQTYESQQTSQITRKS